MGFMQLVMLSGGVGGARMARGLAATPGIDATVVVNVGDDDIVHGLHVAADLDTVVYTVAGAQGPHGWGRDDETFNAMTELERFAGADTSFRLGDRDLGLNLYRTGRLAAGDPLSKITADVAAGFGIGITVIPATDDRLRTRVITPDAELDFQTYFVRRRHADPVRGVRFEGADEAVAAPGVIDAILASDIVLIAPSNPILSIWPILAVAGITDAIATKHVVAVSPLIGGKALKGPAVEVMRGLGYPADHQGVVDCYDGLVHGLVVERGDPYPAGVDVLSTDTRIAEPGAAQRLTEEILAWAS